MARSLQRPPRRGAHGGATDRVVEEIVGVIALAELAAYLGIRIHYVTRASLMAFSGHAVTHFPHD